jgi:hypothetical protein
LNGDKLSNLFRARTALPAMGLALWAVVSGPASYDWVQDNAIHMYDDQNAARTGVFLSKNTPEDATIAVDWAGAIPYFARRTTVDLLGKNDPHIARMDPVAPFRPGHNKWDLNYSLSERKPDFVVVLFLPSAEIRVRGYQPGPPCRTAEIWRR